MKRSAWFLLFLMLFAAFGSPRNAAAQVHRSRLEQGISLYRAGRWADAALELRRSQMEATNIGQLAESLYWLSLAEFSLGEYEATLRDISELQRIAPAGLRIDNMLYYKGRSLYHVNRHEEALGVFRIHGALLDRSGINTPLAQAQKATLAYWIGECLYSLGQQDQAAEFFAQVVNEKPRIEKYEAALYRLSMIQQNKRQAEILGMLDWSYSEYLRVTEEYQQREAAYNKTIAAYQKQVDGILGSAASTVELEAKLTEYRSLLKDAEERIQNLEAMLEETMAQDIPDTPLDQEDAIQHIRELQEEAEILRSSLILP
jgi:tetratricopeptide (TPR) repeat protein